MPAPVGQRFLVPEVVQTSAMDCGPAALKCLLAGFGIPVSYARLREACQTDVDGTSIDTIEDVARQLGLDAEQMISPVDHLLLDEAHLLPALVVTRLPDGLPHFVVIWRVVGPFVQIMDPASGRRWVPRQRLLGDLYRHAVPFPADLWRAWAGSPGFCDPLRRRLADLHIDSVTCTRLIEAALADPHWRALAALDAATRFMNTLVQSGGVQRGQEAAQLLESLLAQTLQGGASLLHAIPGAFWSVQLLLSPYSEAEQTEELLLRGAVLIHVQGRRPATPSPEADAAAKEIAAGETVSPLLPTDQTATLAPALLAALQEQTIPPEREVLRMLRLDGLLTPALVAVAAALAAAGVSLEALLLRGLLQLAAPLPVVGQRLVLLGICIFTLLILLLEMPVAATILRMGRRLELRLRIALLEKLPTLGDQYFRSRLIADMATRAHGLHHLHVLPDLALQAVRLAIQLLLTAGGVILLHPGGAWWALGAIGFALGAALLLQPLLAEWDMRVRTHAGALSRFYLDALLGITPVRTHSAAKAVRREHEARLVAWTRAHLAFHDLQRLIQALVSIIGLGFAIAIVISYLVDGGEASGILLLLYWALNLPALSQSLVSSIQQYPIQRNQLLRLLEPLGAPSEEIAESAATVNVPDPLADGGPPLAVAHGADVSTPRSRVPTGVAIQLENVTVVAGGHVILQDITLTLQPGEHVAIVGSSGAGKSSLVGLLLGWQRATAGQILVDGVPLTGAQLPALRRGTAWVDPAVQLWNRPLLENLRYGAGATDDSAIADILTAADLYDVLEKLPTGLQTRLGEGGGLVSGGEGQRVRLGRALFRPHVRLAILDEPFRGLDRAQRHHLLDRARQHWQAATLICVTHDVGETQNFARVLVLEGGVIVEDGAPQTLAAQPTSRYRALLEAETAVRRTLWEGAAWRHLWLANGRLQEVAQAGPPPPTTKPANAPAATDDLRQIKGIGPVYAARLHGAGIHTFAELAASTPAQIHAIFASTTTARLIKPQAWIDAARQRLAKF